MLQCGKGLEPGRRAPEGMPGSNGFGAVDEFSAVIPGPREARSPESINTTGETPRDTGQVVFMDSGLAPYGAPRNDSRRYPRCHSARARTGIHNREPGGSRIPLPCESASNQLGPRSREDEPDDTVSDRSMARRSDRRNCGRIRRLALLFTGDAPVAPGQPFDGIRQTGALGTQRLPRSVIYRRRTIHAGAKCLAGLDKSACVRNARPCIFDRERPATPPAPPSP